MIDSENIGIRYERAIRNEGDARSAPVWPGLEEFGPLYDFMFEDVPAMIAGLAVIAVHTGSDTDNMVRDMKQIASLLLWGITPPTTTFNGEQYDKHLQQLEWARRLIDGELARQKRYSEEHPYSDS